MKSFRATLILGALILFSFTFLHAAAPQTRGVQITPKAELTLDKFYGQSYAVIIGVSAYATFPSVDYGVKSARAMEEKLLSMGFQTKVLLDREATKGGILKALGEELSQKAQQKDRVVIFFAGHAKTEEKADGSEMGYLIPVDADGKNVVSTSISIDQIREITGRIQANHLLILVDSCLDGLGLTASETIPSKDRRYFQKIASRKGHQLLAAGGKGETAQTGQGGLGLFTVSVLEGLNGSADREGKGFITSAELASYVKLQVSGSTGGKQTTRFGNLAGKGDVVFPSRVIKAEPKPALPGSTQETRIAETSSPQKVEASLSEQAGPKGVDPVLREPDAAQADMQGSTAKVVDEKTPAAADEMSLAAKQARMEELKRLDTERRKTQVALRQPPVPATKAATQAGRFIAYDNGTVLDMRTNLMWASKDNGANITWEDAKKYCENYRAGGHTDWRLPTQEELAGLYDETETNMNPPTAGCSGSYRITSLIHLTCCCPWTSETRGSMAAYFGFSNGPRSWMDQSYLQGIRALPVRSANRQGTTGQD